MEQSLIDKQLSIMHWHPISVHFSVGLLSAAALMLIAAAFLRSAQFHQRLLTVGLWNLWLGAGLMIFTMISGWLAYYSVQTDASSVLALNQHRDAALYTSVTFLLAVVMQLLWYSETPQVKGPTALVLALALVLLAGTVYRGSVLVFSYGLGRSVTTPAATTVSLPITPSE